MNAWLDRWLDEPMLIGCTIGGVLGVTVAHYPTLAALCGASATYLIGFYLKHGLHGRTR